MIGHKKKVSSETMAKVNAVQAEMNANDNIAENLNLEIQKLMSPVQEIREKILEVKAKNVVLAKLRSKLVINSH